MPTPTWVAKTNLREAEVERLGDELKRRISELQLKILSGTLDNAGLNEAGAQLAALRKQMAESLNTSMREQTGRRLRETEKRNEERGA
jgi:hypothetical protein